jgi:pSer/pThr/pTyr-binding forkhead associated (FHA) protein
MVRGNMEIAVRLMRKLSVRARDAERRLCELRDEMIAGGSSSPSVTPAAGAAAQSAESEADETEPRPAGPCFVAEDGRRHFAVPANDAVIGRFDPVTESEPDIDLTEVDSKRSVSRRHARVVRTVDGQVLIEEIGVLNGTFINGARLSPGEPHPLRDGDEVGFGTVKMRFMD